MEQKERTQWIEKAMNSLEGLEPAAPDARLFTVIERRLADEVHYLKIAPKTIHFRTVAQAAACILLLISLNLFVLAGLNRVRSEKNNDVTQLVNDYHLNESPIRYE